MQRKRIKQSLAHRRATFSMSFGLAMGLALSSTTVLAADFSTVDIGIFKNVENSAFQGDVSAQLELGEKYLYGKNVARNQPIAATWYTKAAEANNAEAQFVLGQLYAEGIGVTQDLPTAMKWYRKSADQGNVKAQINLGKVYYDGAGVDRDYAKAYKLFE